MIFEFGRYTIDVDIEKTKEFYSSSLAVRTDEACSCHMCQNFSGAIMTSSRLVLDFLRGLGVDPQKAEEVCGVLGDCEETVGYLGWYPIVGTLLKGRVEGKVYNESNAFLPDSNSEFMFWFEDDRSKMGWINKNFPSPVLEISFSAVLPNNK